ncbi:MAG TPA: hypothetical protein VGP93_20445 [Polyangiaceae bacterium]|jgi:hypothetical protein|nr:hypothetical protein [Polyangiaceae bacterium]
MSDDNETKDSESPPGAGEDAPKKKKKKKRKKADAESAKEPAADAAGEAEPVLDVSGAERAAFLGWFPADPELDRLVRAFEVGNYALIRERGPALVKNAESDKVRAATRELLARIEPDPLMKYLLAAAIALLLFLVLYAYRQHAH